MSDAGDVELAEWRADMLSDLAGEEIYRATRALLSLTYNDPDRVWVERLLIGCLDQDCDPQIRALAVTCMGHVGRIHSSIGHEVVAKLRELLEDSALGGIAEDALSDIRSFAVEE